MVLHSPSRMSPVIRAVVTTERQRLDLSDNSTSHEIFRPCGAPRPESLLPDQPFPGEAPENYRSCLRSALPFRTDPAAGFHPRFVPPSPFSTTLTACSSLVPVVCFDHSHPWGSIPSRVASTDPKISCVRDWVRSQGVPG
jgi:hypothetical protein